MYPPGTRPDVFADGMTYVGLVPFVMDEHQSWLRASASVLRQLPGDQRPAVFRSTTPAGTVSCSGRWKRLGWPSCPSPGSASASPTPGRGCGRTRHDDRITYHSVRRWPRRGLRSRIERRHRRRGGTDAAGGLAHRPMGRPHPQGRPDLVDTERARTVAVARGRHRRAGATSWSRPAWCAPPAIDCAALFSPGVRTRFGRPCDSVTRP